MSIYSSNYRDRLDISYILYHTQKPLVNTKIAKYVHTDILPCGENAVVMIGCYTGHNQDDSIIFNQTSIDRGLFRSISLKKHSSKIIAIVGHHDCAANPVNANEHIRQIKKSAERINSWNLKVTVLGKWINKKLQARKVISI